MPLGSIASELAVPGSTAAGYSQLKHLESFKTTFTDCRTQNVQCRLQTLEAIRSRGWERTNGVDICGTYVRILLVMSDVEVCVCAYLELT